MLSEDDNEILGLIAKIFCVLACVPSVIMVIPAFWVIPMTVKVWNSIRDKKPMSDGFKICVLIFVNIIAGVLLLLRKEPEQTR